MNRMIMNKMITVCLVFIFLNAGATAKTSRAIWAVSDGEKIERDELNSPHKRGNSVWDGKRVKLFAEAERAKGRQFKHGVEVYFQWHGVHWRHNSQKQGERNQDDEKTEARTCAGPGDIREPVRPAGAA